ncbi:MAG: IclR family transcriptional regulator [Sphingomonadales bacterium]|nr:IclR family transcriptional regulator [Sphingomonadales bacterium]
MSESSVERAIAIFEAFERERRPLALKELADFCRMPASTAHALVQTLLRKGWLYQPGRNKDLYPTRRLHDLGSTLLAHDPVLARIEPAMEHLRETTGETVIFGKRIGTQVGYLAVLESERVVRYSARVGDMKPLHSSSIGKALLSVLAAGQARALLAEAGMPSVTPATRTSADALLAEFDAGRGDGCFATHGENVPDVTAFATPILLNADWYALAVAGPSHRMAAREHDIRAALTATREALHSS